MIFGIIYAIGFLIAWVIAARKWYEDGEHSDSESRVLATAMGFFFAISWPLWFTFIAVSRLIFRNSTKGSSK